MNRFIKDPQAKLDYEIDWSNWLDVDETVATSAWAVVAGDVVIEQTSVGPSSTVVWVSGGTLNTNAQVTCHVVTSEDREDDRTLLFHIRSR